MPSLKHALYTLFISDWPKNWHICLKLLVDIYSVKIIIDIRFFSIVNRQCLLNIKNIFEKKIFMINSKYSHTFLSYSLVIY
jgi:hypothetical protein